MAETLVFPKFSYTVIHGVPKPFKKYIYNEKYYMPKSITQFRTDYWTKDDRKAQRQ